MGERVQGLDPSIPIYEGYLDVAKCSDEVRRAVYIVGQQYQRCQFSGHVRYKGYGEKGISVKYSTREFVSWWLHNIKTFVGKKPTCGRIDHSKDYSFDNIKMESLEDNSRERMTRLGPPQEKKPILVLDAETKEPLMWFEHMQNAEDYTKVDRRNIAIIISPKYKNKSGKGFSFQYYTPPKS